MGRISKALALLRERGLKTSAQVKAAIVARLRGLSPPASKP